MNDTVKTWPEKIYVMADNENGIVGGDVNRLYGLAKNAEACIPKDQIPVEYIRADIAKEHEIHEDEAFEIGYNKGIVDTVEKIQKQFQHLKLDPNLKYIEGEIVKKREAKLIQLLKKYCDANNFHYGSPSKSISDLYEEAGLEELK